MYIRVEFAVATVPIHLACVCTGRRTHSHWGGNLYARMTGGEGVHTHSCTNVHGGGVMCIQGRGVGGYFTYVFKIGKSLVHIPLCTCTHCTHVPTYTCAPPKVYITNEELKKYTQKLAATKIVNSIQCDGDGGGGGDGPGDTVTLVRCCCVTMRQ